LFEKQKPTFRIVEHVAEGMVGGCVGCGVESDEIRKNCILYNLKNSFRRQFIHFRISEILAEICCIRNNSIS